MRVENGDAAAYWRAGNVRFAANTYRFDGGQRFMALPRDVQFLET